MASRSSSTRVPRWPSCPRPPGSNRPHQGPTARPNAWRWTPHACGCRSTQRSNGARCTTRRRASCATTTGSRIWPAWSGTPWSSATGRSSSAFPRATTSPSSCGRSKGSWARRMPTRSRLPARSTSSGGSACSAPTSLGATTAGGGWRGCCLAGRRCRAPVLRCWPRGRRCDPARCWSQSTALVGAADHPVALTVEDADGGRRDVVVTPLADERPLRYQAWVAERRAAVHAASDGRAGYLHVPDMMGYGWAQFHRDLRVEVTRDSLVVDLRDNGGGHVSQLVVEKLARTVLGWDIVRHHNTEVYPADAPRGPFVAVVNEQAGSDGDIITAAIKLRGLAPVVGTRTWGGVIGIDGRYHLVDGTAVTQPRYAFWFE